MESAGHGDLRQRCHARVDSIKCVVARFGICAGHFDESKSL